MVSPLYPGAYLNEVEGQKVNAFINLRNYLANIRTRVAMLRTRIAIHSFFLVLIYLILGCHLALGAAVAKIDGPKTGKVGVPVILSSAGSIATVLKWQFVGQEAPESTVLFEGGLLFIPSQPGNYLLILAAADMQSVDATIHIIMVSPPNGPQVSMRATIGGIPNISSPARSLVVERVTPPTRGKFGLAAYTHRMAKTLVSDEYMKSCSKMAANFREVAQSIDEGFHKSKQDALTSLGIKNKADVNGGQKGWEAFFGSITRRLDELAKDGELVTLSDYAIAFRETAAGLDATAQSTKGGAT